MPNKEGNPNRDSKGRFASSGGDQTGHASPELSKAIKFLTAVAPTALGLTGLTVLRIFGKQSVIKEFDKLVNNELRKRINKLL